MKNQRGEVATSVMVLIMVVMMVFGGMHMTHRDHGEQGGSSGHSQHEHGNHHVKGHLHEHQGDAEKDPEANTEHKGDCH